MPGRYAKPPVGTPAFWRASFDGAEEEGRDGFGPNTVAAAVALWDCAETPEEMLAVVVAVMRADLEHFLSRNAGVWPASHLNVARIAYQRAIANVEGIA
jgi:hypothetical protein